MSLNIIELEQRIRAGIPLAAQMDFRVLSLSDNSISVFGGGEQNHNVHGTAFAGSLYAIATLAAWGLVQSRLPDGIELVMGKAEMIYRKPVIGDIVANCTIEPGDFDIFFATLQRKGKARLGAASVIQSGDEGVGAEFNGALYARWSV
jgi:thioesterase domain-containing protein